MLNTTLTLTERQVSTLLAAVRNKLSDYEGDLSEISDREANSEEVEWYEARIAELQPLEKRLNAAGLRLTR